MSGWVMTPAGPDHAHVRPADDVLHHALDEDCLCGPRVDPVQREDGSYGWVIVHHSLDGRERREPDAPS